MRSLLFQAAVVTLLFAIAAALFLHSENGRYQFVKTDANEIVLDTRTGEYWVDASMHVNPRTHKVETVSVQPKP